MCGDRSLVYDSEGFAQIKPAGCKMWSCEVCGPVRLRLLLAEMQNGRPDAMLKLSGKRKTKRTPLQLRHIQGEAVPKLMAMIEKETGVKPEYFVKPELHGNGYPHLHILIRGKLPKLYKIKNLWHRLTGNYQCNIKPLKGVHSIV